MARHRPRLTGPGVTGEIRATLGQKLAAAGLSRWKAISHGPGWRVSTSRAARSPKPRRLARAP
ncbi:hypothetical protein LT493_42830 [Streptomyces tricolor]|nr:hypothetical protein [Streptomyces tricolor]